MNLFVLDTKEMTDLSVIELVWNIKRIGQEQFHAFTKKNALWKEPSLFMLSFVETR